MTDPDQRIDSSASIGPVAGATIVDAEGVHAHIVSVRADGGQPAALVRIVNGPEIMLSLDVLTPSADGVHAVPFAFRSLMARSTDSRIVIPVLREEIQVGKRTVDTGKGVRVHKKVSYREQSIDEPLAQDELQIERITVDRRVDMANPPSVRQEGATLVVPVLEEMLVVEKQLWLKEEVRVTTIRHEIHRPQTVTLRAEQATVEQFDEGVPASSNRSTPPDPHSSMQE